MNFLDVRTVMFSHVITDAVCTAVLVFLWVQNRKRFSGISFLVLDFACQTTAVLLIVLRGSVPDWISMGASNTLVVAGALFGYMGLARFAGRRSRQAYNYFLLAAFVAVHLYFIFVRPNLAARTLNVSLGLLVMCFQCAWLALRGVEHRMRRTTQGVGLVFGVFCLVSIVRIVVVFALHPTSNDFFRSGAYDTLLLMCYQLLMILLTFVLALMVNHRLLGEVLSQEEKFTKAFRSSPYAITLTRPSDGEMLDVNDGFAAITGYSHAEAIGRTTLDLQLWVNEVDRVAVVSDLLQGSRVVGREYLFRKRSGELVTGLFSAEIIRANDQLLILSSISDITDRKRAEEQVKSQLEDLRRWQAVMLDREDRVQELKCEVNELCRRAGQVARYPSQEAGPTDLEAAEPNS
jgi:PAS domain S-box-containing protein